MSTDLSAGDVPFGVREQILRIMRLHDKELGERLRALIAIGPFPENEPWREVSLLEVVAGLNESTTIPTPTTNVSGAGKLLVYQMRQEEFENPDAISESELHIRTRSWLLQPLNWSYWIVLERPHGYVSETLSKFERIVLSQVGRISLSEHLGLIR